MGLQTTGMGVYQGKQGVKTMRMGSTKGNGAGGPQGWGLPREVGREDLRDEVLQGKLGVRTSGMGSTKEKWAVKTSGIRFSKRNWV